MLIISRANCLSIWSITPGRQVYLGKGGKIKESEPKALDKLDLNLDHCAQRVKRFQ